MSDELDKELDDFLSDAPLDDGPPANEPEPESQSAEPEPGTEPAPEPEPEPGPEPEPEPTREPEPPEPEPEPGKEPDIEPLVSEREKLLEAKIEELQGKLLEGGGKFDEPPKPAEPTKAEPELKSEEVNFLGDMQLDDLLDDPVKFNQVLKSVYDRGKADSITAATESVLRSIPQLIATYTSRHNAMSQMVSDFYKANQDLVGVKKTVAAVANEVAAEHPEWKLDDVFKEAATRTRKVLGIKGSVVPKTVVEPEPEPNSNKKPKPAFVDKQGSRKSPGASKLKGLEKEINDLIS